MNFNTDCFFFFLFHILPQIFKGNDPVPQDVPLPCLPCALKPIHMTPFSHGLYQEPPELLELLPLADGLPSTLVHPRSSMLYSLGNSSAALALRQILLSGIDDLDNSNCIEACLPKKEGESQELGGPECHGDEKVKMKRKRPEEEKEKAEEEEEEEEESEMDGCKNEDKEGKEEKTSKEVDGDDCDDCDDPIPAAVHAAAKDGLELLFLGTGCAEPSKV